MFNSRTGKVDCRVLAAFACIVAWAYGNTAAAVDSSPVVALVHSARPLDDVAPGGPIVRDESVDIHVNGADRQTVLTQTPTSACKNVWCPRRAMMLDYTAGVATTGAGRFQMPIAWQSGFSVAGSRSWIKVLKFSSHGINIRLPLN